MTDEKFRDIENEYLKKKSDTSIKSPFHNIFFALTIIIGIFIIIFLFKMPKTDNYLILILFFYLYI